MSQTHEHSTMAEHAGRPAAKRDLIDRLRPRFRSVLLNLLVIIVPIIGVILFDFAVIVEKIAYQHEFKELQDRQVRISRSQTHMLAGDLRQGKHDKVRSQLATILGDPEFIGVRVSATDGRTIAKLGDDVDVGLPELRYTQDIIDARSGTPVKVGQFTTRVTLKPLLDDFAGSRLQYIALTIVMLLTITGAVYIAYRVVAGRPLEQLVHAIRNRDHRRDGNASHSTRVECSGRDEIAELIDDFNHAETQRLDNHWQLMEAKLTLEQKVHERTGALTHALTQAKSANESKAAFLANMSHELRTPLNAIIGFAEVIERKFADDENAVPTHEHAVIIADSGRHLLGLLNSVLDYSKTQSGKLKLDETDFDMVDVAESAVRTFSQAVKDKNITMEMEVCKSPPLITGDMRKITQILLNLLSNAVKFTDCDGRITVSLKHEKDGFAVAVSDNGSGLTSQELEIVMKPFEQAANANAAGAGGTGLGLPLSRELAEMHDGTLRMTSVKGEGTTVRLWLPDTRFVVTKIAAA